MLNIAFTWFKHVQTCSEIFKQHDVPVKSPCFFVQSEFLSVNPQFMLVKNRYLGTPSAPACDPMQTPKPTSRNRWLGARGSAAPSIEKHEDMEIMRKHDLFKSWDFFWFWRINLGTPGNFMLSVVFKGEATGNHGLQTWFHGWLMVKSHEIILEFLVKILVKKLHGSTLSRYKFRCSPKISHDITWPLGPKNDFYYWTWPKSYGWAHAYGISLWYSHTNVGETVRNDSYFPWGLKHHLLGWLGGQPQNHLKLNTHRNWCENRVREHPVA